MAKLARSARGEVIDFDVLAIIAAIAKAPVPGVVQARREFIDEKDGVRSRGRQQILTEPSTPPVEEHITTTADVNDAMALSMAAVEISAAAAEKVEVDDKKKSK